MKRRGSISNRRLMLQLRGSAITSRACYEDVKGLVSGEVA
jgi:hypothetical protein